MKPEEKDFTFTATMTIRAETQEQAIEQFQEQDNINYFGSQAEIDEY